MSDRHEADLADLFDGTRTRNSGAVWSDEGDGHQTNSDEHWRFSWDGKSTLGKSVGVSLEMWTKAVQQSRGLLTLLPLRWYGDNRLTKVLADLVVLDLKTFAEILEDANRLRRILNCGCLSGAHDIKTGSCIVCETVIDPYEE